MNEMVELTDEEFGYIASHFKVRKFRKHAIICHPGDLVTTEYFVVKGLLKTSVMDDHGKEYILQFAMENWWVSDYNALHSHEPAEFSIACLEDTVLLVLSIADRQKLSAELHKFETFFSLKTTSGFINLQKRVMALLKNDAHSRYKQLFAQYPTLFQRVPKSLIAAYLGVTRETLSRLSL
ncbi:Crp/Fnr family transcriptional regulator [Pedobacter sp. AW31-3R]|uniref:Crp/Fnr family transcriptional regulator n=1 Tax=Pedobacter sp. AW31-3R TaxID=3445781 RepID=UPI003F9FC46F